MPGNIVTDEVIRNRIRLLLKTGALTGQPRELPRERVAHGRSPMCRLCLGPDADTAYHEVDQTAMYVHATPCGSIWIEEARPLPTL